MEAWFRENYTDPVCIPAQNERLFRNELNTDSVLS